MELVELFIDILTDILTDITADVPSRTELKVRVKIRQPKELKVFNSLRLSIVLLLVIRCWDSLKN